MFYLEYHHQHFLFIVMIRPTLKNVCFLSPAPPRKKIDQAAGNFIFTLFKLNITFYFKCVTSTIIAA